MGPCKNFWPEHWVSHLWFGFGKFPLKMWIFRIFALQEKKSLWVGLLFTCGAKVSSCRVGEGQCPSLYNCRMHGFYNILARSGAAKPPPLFVFRHAPSRPRDGTDVRVLYILISQIRNPNFVHIFKKNLVSFIFMSQLQIIHKMQSFFLSWID